jgi:hypothetical protein
MRDYSHFLPGIYFYNVTIAIPELCGGCTAYTSCTACAPLRACEWCLDTSSCVPAGASSLLSRRSSSPSIDSPPSSSCENYIIDPAFCPKCSASNCKQCTETGCTWCAEGRCAVDGSTCKAGTIKNPAYCPN